MKLFSIFSAHLAAAFLVFFAFGHAATTIATSDMRDYQTTVVSSLVCAALAVLLELFVFRKSGILGRCFAVGIILFATLIIANDIQRLHYIFNLEGPPIESPDRFRNVSERTSSESGDSYQCPIFSTSNIRRTDTLG